MRKKFHKVAAWVMLVVMFCIGFGCIVYAAEEPNVQKKILLVEGKAKTLKIEGKNIESKIFTSTNKKVATVNKEGKVVAKKAGKCKIKVLVKYKKTKASKQLSVKKLQCSVKVEKAGSGSDVSPTVEPSVDVSDNEAFISQTANFSMQLFQNSTAGDMKKGKNVLVSPESVIVALSMTANGADGDTLAELEKVICGNMHMEDFNGYLSAYNQQLAESKGVKFHNANSIWIQDAIKVQEEFLDTNKKYYGAEVFSSPFNTETVENINKWVKTNTDDMIDKLLDEIPANAIMYLINAIAFEGKWMEQYKDYQVSENEKFTNSKGEKQKATMLCDMEDEYIKGENEVGFVKPYKGGKYAFMALLPDEKISMADYVSDLSGEKFLNLYKNRKQKSVETKIPEFSYDYSAVLNDSLSAMGIKKAFAPGADFTRIAKDNLYISSVLHKTFIELDRYGTKAAAVTAVEMAKGAAPSMEEKPKVYLDRPFVYAIINTDTGLPVFVGAVNRMP